MNGRDIIASDTEPVAEDQEDALLTVHVGDTIKLWDVSSPKENIVSRTWDIDGDGEADYDNTDYPPDIIFTKPGSHRITLCINGPDQCISKWVEVSGKAPVVVKKEPSIVVLSPRSTGRRVSGSTVQLRLRTENVFNREDITVKVGGRPTSQFSFADGIVSSTLKLRPGTNNIEVEALTNSGRASEVIRVVRKAADVAPAPTVPNPEVSIGGVVSETTEASAIDLRFAAKNASVNQIDATVNGRPIPEATISLNGRRGLIKKVPLEIGQNSVIITARTDGGTTKSRYSIERLAPLAPVAEEDTVVYTPPPALPSVPIDPEPAPVSAGGVAWFGVPAANVSNANCDGYGVTNTSMQLSPKEPVVLMGADVYSSGCGTLTVTLSTGRASVKEFFELSAGQTSLTFNRLSEKELVSNLRYKVILQTGPSPNCASNTPKLLDAKTCGKSNSGDDRVALSYGDNVSLFSIKYKY